MLARDATIVAIDFEGTGSVPPHPDEPWQIGLVPVKAGRLVCGEAYSSLLRVGPRPFSRYAPGRHAAQRAEIEAAPPLPELWPVLKPRLTGVVLCAHNISTEKRYLKHAFPMQAFGPWIDTLRLARVAFPTLKSHRLEALVDTLGLAEELTVLCPGGEPHDALYDAMACGLVLVRLLGLDAWATASLEALILARA